MGAASVISSSAFPLSWAAFQRPCEMRIWLPEHPCSRGKRRSLLHARLLEEAGASSEVRGGRVEPSGLTSPAWCNVRVQFVLCNFVIPSYDFRMPRGHSSVPLLLPAREEVPKMEGGGNAVVRARRPLEASLEEDSGRGERGVKGEGDISVLWKHRGTRTQSITRPCTSSCSVWPGGDLETSGFAGPWPELQAPPWELVGEAAGKGWLGPPGCPPFWWQGSCRWPWSLLLNTSGCADLPRMLVTEWARSGK